ncbi:MAG: hypothetical protein NVS4B9_16900 [Ktedonobacteraceae bacterium]
MQSIGVALLAMILSGAITITLPAEGAIGRSDANLPPAARAAAAQALHQFQSQYITGLERAYLVTCIVAIIATALSLFLPGWPGKYQSGSGRQTEAAPQEQASSIA